MILFTCGWFHSATPKTDIYSSSYIEDSKAFYVILFLLVLDRFSQKWQSNERFGCTKEI